MYAVIEIKCQHVKKQTEVTLDYFKSSKINAKKSNFHRTRFEFLKVLF